MTDKKAKRRAQQAEIRLRGTADWDARTVEDVTRQINARVRHAHRRDDGTTGSRGRLRR